MGRHHARVYREMPNVDLVAVVDADPEIAAEVGRMYGVQAYTDVAKMLEEAAPDAVSVAVPTHAHYAVTTQLLKAGCHVLVEKPIAATYAEALQMVEAAEAVGRKLMVGHIERFNPAVLELKRRLDGRALGQIFQIHARRLGPFPTRIQDVGVIMDLATHDLDIMRFLTGSEVDRAYAEIRRDLHHSHEDLLNGILRFHNSTVGVLEINWLTPTKIRDLYVTGERGMFYVNYITQDLFFYENAQAHGEESWAPLSLLRGVSEGVMVRFAIHKKEPLRAELEAFIDAVCGRVVDGAHAVDGMVALELAIALAESAQMRQVREIAHNGNKPGIPSSPAAEFGGR